jgi:hypothetical protein
VRRLASPGAEDLALKHATPEEVLEHLDDLRASVDDGDDDYPWPRSEHQHWEEP